MNDKEKIQKLQQRIDTNSDIYLQNMQSMEEVNEKLRRENESHRNMLETLKSQFKDSKNDLFYEIINKHLIMRF